MPDRPTSPIFLAIATLLSLASVAQADEKRSDFAHDVAPVLKKHCVACHGGKESKGGFSLNTRGLLLDAEAAVPGKPDDSRLIELVNSDDPEEQMPPKDRPRLTAKEIAALKLWIGEGLKWEPGFTFAAFRYEPPLRPRSPKLPPAIDGRANPIDRILDNYQRKLKLPRPQPLDDAHFQRRLSLDLLGLLPTFAERDEFLRDEAGEKRLRLVRGVLGRNQQYAEHWMTFWNDLLRNAYSGTGYIDGGRRQITGWLYGSLLQNKPYDEFVRELIAPTPESEGFIRGIKWRGNVNASQKREVQFAQSVSQVLLGINLKCASCHDSFIDRWTLEEAYGLSAIYSNRPLEIHRCDKPTGKTAKAAWLFPELGAVDAAAPQPKRLEQLAALMTHKENGRFARTIVNRIWGRLMGRGIVHPVDAMQTKPWSEDLLDYLAADLVRNKYDLKATIALIVTSQAYQSEASALPERPGGDSYQYTGPLAKRMTAEQFLDAIWTITDTWPKPDGRAFKKDGRQQGGQLAAVLKVHQADAQPSAAAWGERRVRAVFTPLTALQASLGRPNREQVVTSRPNQLTTLEAINLSNGQPLAELLARGAEQLAERKWEDGDALLDWLYRFALSRPPTSEERAVALEIVGPQPAQQGIEDLLWAVFMLPEFQLIR